MPETGNALQRHTPQLEICILAGGLSSRMGRNKSRLRIGRRTLLGHVRHTASQVGVPVRVIRHDLVERCGPLGGIYTALKTTRAAAVLFLACDMPFVSSAFIEKVVNRSKGKPIFTQTDSVGFPFLLTPQQLEIVEKQIAAKRFSLHSLAAALHAKIYHPNAAELPMLTNINTPEDVEDARSLHLA